MSSEYVRKELKAVVGARTNQRGHSGAAVNLNQTLSGPGMMSRNSPPLMVPGGKPLNQADLEALGLTYELHQGMYPFWVFFVFFQISFFIAY